LVVMGMFWIVVCVAWIRSKCLAKGLLVHGLKHWWRALSPSQVMVIVPPRSWYKDLDGGSYPIYFAPVRTLIFWISWGDELSQSQGGIHFSMVKYPCHHAKPLFEGAIADGTCLTCQMAALKGSWLSNRSRCVNAQHFSEGRFARCSFHVCCVIGVGLMVPCLPEGVI